MLERLIQEQYASMRKLLVSALLLGGDVSVGSDDRFAGVPACRSTSQTGCIVAYSSWKQTPPQDAGEQGCRQANAARALRQPGGTGRR